MHSIYWMNILFECQRYGIKVIYLNTGHSSFRGCSFQRLYMHFNNVDVDFSVLNLINECILLRDNQLSCSDLIFFSAQLYYFYLCGSSLPKNNRNNRLFSNHAKLFWTLYMHVMTIFSPSAASSQSFSRMKNSFCLNWIEYHPSPWSRARLVFTDYYGCGVEADVLNWKCSCWSRAWVTRGIRQSAWCGLLAAAPVSATCVVQEMLWRYDDRWRVLCYGTVPSRCNRDV